MKKPLESQRKTPQQERSKAIVSSIFEATVRILPRIGSQNITTRKIAELAGVSIGSLYQYFPNKESVLTAIMDLATKSSFETFLKKVDELQGKSMEELTQAMVDLGLETFLSEKEKVREIYRLAPELGRIPSLLKMRQHVVDRLATEMKRLRPGFLEEEYIRVSFIAVNSLMGVVQTMLYDDEQDYSINELSTELNTMLTAYFDKKSIEQA